LLSEKFYISLSQLHFTSEYVKEGACIEIACQLGEEKITELCFYSAKVPTEIRDYFKLALVNQSFNLYFKGCRANCLKVEIFVKDYNYDNKVGSSFMPIESVVMVLE